MKVFLPKNTGCEAEAGNPLARGKQTVRKDGGNPIGLCLFEPKRKARAPWVKGF